MKKSMAINPASGGLRQSRRGFVLMMLSWSIAAFALIMQVFMVQGVTGLRVVQWQQQDLQARQFAEAGLDTIVNFYMRTKNQSCYDWQKTDFGVLTAMTSGCATSAPCTCGTDVYNEILNGKNTVRTSNALAVNDANLMIVYRILGSGPVKTITVKGYRDWGTNALAPSANARAIAEVGAKITLVQQIVDGLVGLNSVHVASFGNIDGDLSTTNPSPSAIHLTRNTWVKGRILIPTLPASMYLGNNPLNAPDPSKFSQWIGDQSSTQNVVLEDGVGVMDEDPANFPTTSGRTFNIDSVHGGQSYIIDDPRHTVADMKHVVTSAKLSTELTGVLSELSSAHTPDQILTSAGLNPATCAADNIDLGEFGTRTITVPANVDKVCFKYINTLRNATITFSHPVTVYISGYNNPLHIGDEIFAVDLGPFAEIKAVDSGGATVPNGVVIKIANSNAASNSVRTSRDAILNGSILAPESHVIVGAFNGLVGGTIFGKDLDLERMANPHGLPADAPNQSTKGNFRVLAGSGASISWIDRPDPEP